MSRWTSIQNAARRARQAAKEAQELRKEKRRSWLLVIGLAVASIGLTVGDYFWMRNKARQHYNRHHEHHQHGTNGDLPDYPMSKRS